VNFQKGSNQGKHPPRQPAPPDGKGRDDLPEQDPEDVKDHEP